MKLLFVAAVIAVGCIFLVRHVETQQQATQQATQASATRDAYCQRYYANRRIYAQEQAEGKIPDVGSMLNLYNC